jgi:AcrR family transcriptional regulator
VTENATKWDARRAETTRRLRRRALELTRDRGFDGWTMDDLAESADVSRRTVFNYFDSKLDVVLGPDHQAAGPALDAFLAKQPTGNLVDDLVELASEMIQEKATDLDLVMLGRSVVLNDPELTGIVHRRFEDRSQQMGELILRREGEEYGAWRAQLAVRLLVTVFDTALTRIDLDEPRPFHDYLTDAVADARALFSD